MKHSAPQAAIVGIGEADFKVVPGKTSFMFCAEAAKRAIEDAGLKKDDIDGLVGGYTMVEPFPFYSAALCEYLQIRPRHHSSIVTGGAVYAMTVAHAAATVAAGVCHTVLVVHGDSRQSRLSREAFIAQGVTNAGHPDFESPYGPLIPSMYALAAQRHMYEYGTTSEQLAQIAVSQRKHAALHPKALMREPITVADVLNSKMIATPLHMLDCCLVSDSGGAVIVTTPERARDLPHRPVYLLGAGEGFHHEFISQAPKLTTTGAKDAGNTAYEMAGVGPKDIDFAELYDCFTITVLITLEDLGFCAAGEGGPFVQNGRIEIGGELPINTHGGLLSYCNGAILHVVEGVKQLRGDAGPRQVLDAKIGLVHAQGGVLSTHCTLILARG